MDHAPARTTGPRWAKVIDNTRCIGCHACTVACKSENAVPLSVTRTYVKYVDVGEFPQARRAFQVTRCNMCDHPPCVAACPTHAMFRRPDGLVDFDKSLCIGCKACIAACPYDAIFINPDDHSAEKCNFCAHRLDIGLEPACVVVCPTEAIMVGDLDDPDSRVAAVVKRDAVTVRRPEKETLPKLFYKAGHQATLDPLAARRPEGGLYLWSEQGGGADQVRSGHPGAWNSAAAALLSYDVPQHRRPWDARVSLYTWTKGISAGAYLVGLLLAALGIVSWESPLWLWSTPVLAGMFLILTAGILIWDLEHPRRFHYIFTHPQWRSWLVRGGVILTAYGLLMAMHYAAGLFGGTRFQIGLAALAAPAAAATAVYTAYLFAQAKARDLWQNPLLPPHLLVQAVLLGAAVLAPAAALSEPLAVPALETIVGWTALAHLLLVAGEITPTHVTAHARLAVREMTRGEFAGFFWAGSLLVTVAVLTPWLGMAGVLAGLIGMLLYEHAYVQAGQAVPLA